MKRKDLVAGELYAYGSPQDLTRRRCTLVRVVSTEPKHRRVSHGFYAGRSEKADGVEVIQYRRDWENQERLIEQRCAVLPLTQIRMTWADYEPLRMEHEERERERKRARVERDQRRDAVIGALKGLGLESAKILYPHGPTLSEDDWDTLLGLAAKGRASEGAAPLSGEEAQGLAGGLLGRPESKLG